MIKSSEALLKFGNPNLLATQIKHMELWVVEPEIRAAFSHVRFSALGTIGFPKKIFINKQFKKVLQTALLTVIYRGLAHELKIWDGCFMIRKKTKDSTLSLHSWGLAIDINAQDNGYGMIPNLSKEFVQCFLDAGCVWGGYWSVPDGMHFQLSELI